MGHESKKIHLTNDLVSNVLATQDLIEDIMRLAEEKGTIFPPSIPVLTDDVKLGASTLERGINFLEKDDSFDPELMEIADQTLRTSHKIWIELSEALKKRGFDDALDELRNKIEQASQSIISIREYSTMTGLDRALSEDEIYRKLKESYKSLDSKISDLSEKSNEIASFNIEAVKDLSKEITNLEERIKKKLSIADDIYDEESKKMDSRNKELDKAMGQIVGRVIADDYQESANQEMLAADNLRKASLGVMLIITATVLFSLYETTQPEFQWDNSLFRMIFIFLLSVPAAYLARESAKHRQQQYRHQQTDLDLNAITPYLASLPEEERHKLKSEFASRLFAAKDFSNVGNDSYPVNSHEIIMQLIKQADLKKTKDEKSESQT